MKILGTTLLFIAMAGALLAQPVPSPEIDANTAGTALALLSGALLVIRARRK